MSRLGSVSSALLAAALFGLSVPMAKVLLSEIDPQLLAGLFYMGAGVGLGIFSLTQGLQGQVNEAPLTRFDLPWLSGAALFGGIAAPLLLLLGVEHTAASDASLLLNFESVFTVAFAWIAFHEFGGRRVTFGIIAIIIGGFVASWQGFLPGGVDPLGPLAVIGACICWAADNNLTQRISSSDPAQIAAIKGLAAGLVNTNLALWLGSPLFSPIWIGAALVIGFFSYGLSLMLFVFSLRNLGTSRTTAYFSTGPFIGAFASLLILNEALTASLLISMAFMAVGVWGTLTERHEHLHPHELLVHSHRHVHDEHHHHEHVSGTPGGEPHTHMHSHQQLAHSHVHFPDIHHRHKHESSDLQ